MATSGINLARGEGGKRKAPNHGLNEDARLSSADIRHIRPGSSSVESGTQVALSLCMLCWRLASFRASLPNGRGSRLDYDLLEVRGRKSPKQDGSCLGLQ